MWLDLELGVVGFGAGCGGFGSGSGWIWCCVRSDLVLGVFGFRAGCELGFGTERGRFGAK